MSNLEEEFKRKKPIHQRSTNNSKSCELFNYKIDSCSKLKKIKKNDVNDSLCKINSIPSDFELPPIFHNLGNNPKIKPSLEKKIQNEQIKIHKKKMAFEKRLMKEKEREAKRIQKESIRKYRNELKAEIKNAKFESIFSHHQCLPDFTNITENRRNLRQTNSNTSLGKDLEQFVANNNVISNKSISYSNFQIGNLKKSLSNQNNYFIQQNPYDFDVFTYNQSDWFPTNDTQYLNNVSPKLEPFRVNLNPVSNTSFNLDTSINYNDFVPCKHSSPYDLVNKNSNYSNQIFLNISSNEKLIDNSELETKNSDFIISTVDFSDINYNLIDDLDKNFSVYLINQDFPFI
jgi:hypothetical protein